MKLKGQQIIPVEVEVSSYELVDAMISVVCNKHKLDRDWYIHLREDGKCDVMRHTYAPGHGNDVFVRKATDEDIQVFGLIEQLQQYYGT